jgi:hypothetical protein
MPDQKLPLRVLRNGIVAHVMRVPPDRADVFRKVAEQAVDALESALDAEDRAADDARKGVLGPVGIRDKQRAAIEQAEARVSEIRTRYEGVLDRVNGEVASLPLPKIDPALEREYRDDVRAMKESERESWLRNLDGASLGAVLAALTNYGLPLVRSEAIEAARARYHLLSNSPKFREAQETKTLAEQLLVFTASVEQALREVRARVGAPAERPAPVRL